MTEESDYEKILADLEEERAGIDLMIAFVKRRMGVLAETQVQSALPTKQAMANLLIRPFRLSQDSFFRMSVPEAIKKYLNIAKRPKTAKDITAGLESGGLTHQAKNLYATVYPTLLRMEKANEVVRVGKGEWGLAEWYPSGRKTTQEEKTQNEA